MPPETPDTISARLRGYIKQTEARFPEIWRMLYDLRRAGIADREIAFPADRVFLPAPVVLGVLKRLTPRGIPAAGTILALTSWRYTQGIYRFHPSLVQALVATPLAGELPAEVLRRLPEWSVYIPFQGTFLEQAIKGFFAVISFEDTDGTESLQLIVDFGRELLPVLPIPLAVGGLKEALDAVVRRVRERGGAVRVTQGTLEEISAMVNLVLYLCTLKAEIEDSRKKRERPGNPLPQKLRKGEKLFPAAGITDWSVGWRIGETLRRIEELDEKDSLPNGPDGTVRRSPRPHLRKHHWHSYRIGPRTGNQEIVLYWIPTIPVGTSDDIIPIVHRVEP